MEKPAPDAPEDEFNAYHEHIGDIAISICCKAFNDCNYGRDKAEELIWDGFFKAACLEHNLTADETENLRQDISEFWLDTIPEQLEEYLKKKYG
ncbi:MAG: hypothetical protein DRQ01_00855 [Ignavibacteriae bacterium]|nr:MAG: hypothetical protein DRQ01_00855 [Ignavibacteriota bacterium]